MTVGPLLGLLLGIGLLLVWQSGERRSVRAPRSRPTWQERTGELLVQAGIEGVLGIRREGAFLVIDPCIPPDWPGYEASVKVDGTRYDIRVISASRRTHSISRAVLDSEDVPVQQGPLRFALDGAVHSLRLEMDMITEGHASLAEDV